MARSRRREVLRARPRLLLASRTRIMERDRFAARIKARALVPTKKKGGGECDLLVEEIGMCSGAHKRDLVALRPVDQ